MPSISMTWCSRRHSGLRDTTGVEVDTTAVCAGRVRGSTSQLRSMVGNLLDNAARQAATRVVVSLVEQHDKGAGRSLVRLRVDDDGAGVEAADRVRIFDRFVRLDDARSRDHGGAGLGLAIVAEVASAHDGTVMATAAPGGGARFEVRLPVAG
jgi:signal transduction histidine kinase